MPPHDPRPLPVGGRSALGRLAAVRPSAHSVPIGPLSLNLVRLAEQMVSLALHQQHAPHLRLPDMRLLLRHGSQGPLPDRARCSSQTFAFASLSSRNLTSLLSHAPSSYLEGQRRGPPRSHRRRDVHQVSRTSLLAAVRCPLSDASRLCPSLMRSYFARIGDSAHPDHEDSRVRAITNFQELLGLCPPPALSRFTCS